jgi:hypothetical protein
MTSASATICPIRGCQVRRAFRDHACRPSAHGWLRAIRFALSSRGVPAAGEHLGSDQGVRLGLLELGGRGDRRPLRRRAVTGPALSGVGVGPRLVLDEVFPELRGGAGDVGAELGGEHARGQFRPAAVTLEERLVVGELRALGGCLLVR